MRSVLIKNMFEDLGSDSDDFTNAIPLPNVSSVLHKAKLLTSQGQ